MATATATSVTVRFDPTATSLQADIIGPATASNAGVMTATQVQTLDSVSEGVSNDNTAQTPDATPTTVSSFAVPLGKTLFVEAYVMGTRDDGSQGAAYVMRAAFRNDAGVVSQVGSTSDDYIAEDDSTWVGPDVSISGTDVLITVAGKAGVTINWVVDYQTRS